MPTFSPQTLERFGTDFLRALGAPPDEAAIVARSLVEANLTGHDSHGIVRLERYALLVRAGRVTPGGKITLARETPATALVDGGWNFGQVVCRQATELAIQKARDCGVSAVGMRNCGHIGRLGEYPLMAAEAGMAGILFSNSHGGWASVAPFGGRDGQLATNPLAIATPGPEHPVVLDITTSVVAEGQVRLKLHAGEEVPEGWLIDGEGKPTTDPGVLAADPPGAMLPLGGEVGYKGYGLAVMIDLLAGALTGAGCSDPRATTVGNASLMIVLDIGKFVPPEEFLEHARGLAERLHGAPLAPGFTEILLPGEASARQARRRREGIPIDEGNWQLLRQAAEELGIPPPGER